MDLLPANSADRTQSLLGGGPGHTQWGRHSWRDGVDCEVALRLTQGWLAGIKLPNIAQSCDSADLVGDAVSDDPVMMGVGHRMRGGWSDLREISGYEGVGALHLGEAGHSPLAPLHLAPALRGLGTSVQSAST